MSSGEPLSVEALKIILTMGKIATYPIDDDELTEAQNEALLDEYNKSKVTQEVTYIKKIAITTTSIIFEISFSEAKKEKMSQTYNLEKTKYVIKLMKNSTASASQLQNEINIHKALSSDPNPICPKFIYDAKYDDIKTEFNALLKGIDSPKEQSIIKEFMKEATDFHIIMMEYIDCTPLYQLSYTPHTIEDIGLTSLNLENIEMAQSFLAYYLATLMAFKGYSHGDLHTGNIYFCKSTNKPLLIDFGHSNPISNLTIDSKLSKVVLTNEFIQTIYEELNDKTIERYIESKKQMKKYIEIVIALSMCTSITLGESMCYYVYETSGKLKSLYEYLYNSMTSRLAESFNLKIQELLTKRTLPEKKGGMTYKKAIIEKKLQKLQKQKNKKTKRKKRKNRKSTRCRRRKH